MAATPLGELDLPDVVTWSVSITDAESGRVLAEHDPARLLSAASIGKVFVLIELAERLAAGDLAPGTMLDRRSVAAVADSGLWHRLTTDTLPVADIATLVGAVSDNWATNVLIDRLGLESIRARAAEWAPGGSTLHDIVRGRRGPDDPPHLALACAADLTTVFARLWRECEHPPAAQVLAWLRSGVDLSLVAGAFAQDPLAHEEDGPPHLVHKTGSNLGVRADTGLVSTDHRTLAYAVLANWPPDRDRLDRDLVLASMRAIGQNLRGWLADADRGSRP